MRSTGLALRKEDKAFDLRAEDLVRLKKAKASDAALKVMLDPESAATVAPPAAAVAPADPNGPTAPHGSGIDLNAKDDEERLN